ncbi:MAG: tRNA-specific 2-thiouridylase, partial [Myxococcota bacterium]
DAPTWCSKQWPRSERRREQDAMTNEQTGTTNHSGESKGKVMVAMSGGVDSSVAAALMVEQGYDVIGVTMHLSDAEGDEAEKQGTCCAPDDAHDARRVAAHLDIPHYVVNYKKSFKKAVIDAFVADYQNGVTPSPCVRCNDVLKFRMLYQRAVALGCDFLATGHYARIVNGPDGSSLLRGVNQSKDQSYFLFGVPRDALARVRFPVGELSKDEVREVARRHDLPVANKPESQDICFVPDGDYASFVERHATPTTGEVVSTDGTVLGEHAGIHRFTIGQRRGLGLPGGAPRRFVIGISSGDGRVTVGSREELQAIGLVADDCNWLGPVPSSGDSVLVRIRHRSGLVPATVLSVPDSDGGLLELRFASELEAVAPGQAAVLYDPTDGQRVLGGGWIRRAVPATTEAVACSA